MPFENSVPSQVIWVSPDGSDDNTGARDAPLQSIQLAIDRATPGTAISLLPGNYTGNFEFQNIQGTPDKPIWLAAADGPGTVTITAASNDASVITIRGEDNIVIRDLTLVGGHDGIEISQSGTNFTDLVHNVVVQGNTIINAANDGIKVGDTDNALILDNIVNGTKAGQGIDMLGVTNSTVDGNEIMNVSGSSGMFVKGGSSNVAITNNYIHDVAGDGLLIGGTTNADAFLPGTNYEARDITATGNVVEDAAKRPLTVLGAVNVDVHDNWFGSMSTNEHVVLVGPGSSELSPQPESSNVAIHDNVFDRAFNFEQVDPGSQDISFSDNIKDGVVEGDMRTSPPDHTPPSFVSTLPDSLLDAPVWPTSARSTHSFTAGSGNQTLTGTSGNDFLSGGGGDDTTIGGAGDDVHSIGSSRDRIIELPGEGIDTALVYIAAYTLPDNVENLTVSYTGGGTYHGNALDNILLGGLGNDTLSGGAGRDLFVASATGGSDIITDFTLGSGDRVDLRAFPSFTSVDDVLAHAVQIGTATQIALGGTATLTLNGISLANLTGDDFLFQSLAKVVNAPPTGIDLSGASIPEDASPGTVVGTLTASDPTEHETFTYSLLDNPGSLFAINDNQLVLAGAADYETAQSHAVTVRVTDSGGNTFDQSFDITVTDVAPSAPVDSDSNPNQVVEGADNGTLVGLTAEAFDVHGGAVSFALIDDAGGRFAIDATTGVVSVADGSLLDYEVAQTHQIVVAALDGSGAVNTESFLISLINVDGVTITGTAAPDFIDGSHAPAGQPFATVEGDTISGGAGNDAIASLSGNDMLIGGSGADIMDGGTGTDTASYATAHAAVVVSLATGSGSAGDAAGDLLFNIENITGSSYSDTIEGNGGNNTLAGGDGVDTLNYEHASAGVTISLAITLPQDTGGAGVDRVSGFEYVLGSAFDDTITGSKVANALKGGDGNDVLNGGAGDDLLVGGNGNDTLTGGTGADGFVFNTPNEGADTITDFVSGSDWLRIAASAFGGGLAAGQQPTLVTVEDRDGAAASHTGTFIFDNAGTDAGTLYWDAAGDKLKDATVIAHLTGVTSLTPSDFHIV